jgi:hypothetical protein
VVSLSEQRCESGHRKAIVSRCSHSQAAYAAVNFKAAAVMSSSRRVQGMLLVKPQLLLLLFTAQYIGQHE